MERRKCIKRKRLVQRKIPAPAPSASSSAYPPPWIELPGDVTANILQRLGAEGMLRSAQQVCRTWWKVCKDPAMWRVIDLFNPDSDSRTVKRKYAAMCRRAVDRSQGQLIDLTIDSFGDEELINYVADRSRNLKRLKLVSCFQIFGCFLVEAVEKLGQLEELHLNMIRISSHHIEAIGNACPNLKSFSFNKRGSTCQLPPFFDNGEIDDKLDPNGYARAIGKCMPNLHHLQLCSFEMQDGGLKAILDGCPRLESLDIRQCSGLDLGGDLGKRCREQLKDLRLPNDSFGDLLDYDFDENDFDEYNYYQDLECYDDYAPLEFQNKRIVINLEY